MPQKEDRKDMLRRIGLFRLVRRKVMQYYPINIELWRQYKEASANEGNVTVPRNRNVASEEGASGASSPSSSRHNDVDDASTPATASINAPSPAGNNTHSNADVPSPAVGEAQDTAKRQSPAVNDAQDNVNVPISLGGNATPYDSELWTLPPRQYDLDNPDRVAFDIADGGFTGLHEMWKKVG